MNRRVSDDTATYAADCIVDAPLPRKQFYLQAAGDPQSTSSLTGSEREQELGEC